MEQTIQHIEVSYYHVKRSIHELKQLNMVVTDQKLTDLHKRFFSFHHRTIVYCLVNEFCKLFENLSIRFPNNHSASLYRLTNDETHLGFIKALNSRAINEKIRNLRDKEYSHSDIEKEAYSFSSFSKDELSEIDEIMMKVCDLIQDIADIHIVFNSYDDSTIQFFQSFVKYKEFYFKQN